MATRPEVSAYMRKIGRKGGLVGGKRRLETMTPAERCACASHAASARWAKHAKAQTPSTWSKSEWPTGTRFEIRFKDGIRLTNCVLSRYTAARVYWFKPEYDGTNHEARRHRLEDFKADVASGKISKWRRRV